MTTRVINVTNTPVRRYSDSAHNRPEMLQKWNEHLANLFIPLDVIFCLFILIGFFGNCMVVFMYKFRMTGKMKDRYFIPVLATMDALVCFFGPTISLVLSIYPVTFYGNILCKVSIFLFRVPLNSSILLTFVIGYFRYRKMCIIKGSTTTMKQRRLATILTVVISIFLAIPMLIFYGEVPVTKSMTSGNTTVNVTGCRCGIREESDPSIALGLKIYMVFGFLIVLGVIVALIVFYSFIGRKIYVQSKTIEKSRSISHSSSESDSHSSSNKPSHGRTNSTRSQESNKLSLSLTFNKRSTRSEGPSSPFENRLPFQFNSKQRGVKSVSKRYTRLFMAISMFFILSYIPTLVINLVLKNWDSPKYWQESSDVELQGYTFLFFTYLLNHVANPFFYAYFDSSFRKRVCKTFICWK